MKNTKKSKYFYYICLCVLLITSQFVRASETFQNNLVKTEVHKNSLGAVKVTLYTSKPYSENVTVNKKSATEYVILMPETSNSLTTKPSFGAASDVVKNVEVKTQQFGNQLKGYTKITISTTKPIEISPHVQTVKDSKFSEKDYKELMAATGKSKKSVTKTAPSKLKAAKTQKTKTVTKEKKLKPIILAQKTTTEVKKKRKEPVSTRIATREQNIEKHVQKPIKKVIKQEEKASTQTQQAQNQPSEAPQQVQQVQPQKPVEQQPSQTAQTSPAQTAQVPPPITPEPQVSELQKYKNIIKNNLYAVLGAIFVGFLLLLMIAKKMTKNLHKQKEIFTSNLEEKPVSAVDYTEKINEDMDWREKYQTYMETKEASEKPAPEKTEKDFSAESQELDSLFGNEPVEETTGKPQTYAEPEIPISQEIQPQVQSDFDEVEDYSMEENEVSIDDLFAEDETETPVEILEFKEEEPEQDFLQELSKDSEIAAQEVILEKEPEEEKDELIKSEFIIEDGKGFYLVDYEDTTALVGQIDDEIFVLKRFDEKIKSPIQARLNERKQNSLNYMTKVGTYKALVEVTKDRMNLLIEL